MWEPWEGFWQGVIGAAIADVLALAFVALFYLVVVTPLGGWGIEG